MIGTTTIELIAPPRRLAAHTHPWARARCVIGNQREITPEMFG
jgi:hypothetical protein